MLEDTFGCISLCVFSRRELFFLIQLSIRYFNKAWYTDPDLNTLDLTGTHNNQAQNSSHHQLQTSTLGDNHTTSNTSSNVATTTAITATRTGSGKFSNENDSECSSVTSDSMPGG